MKQARQAIVLVDNYRRPSRQRNTAGRYRVCAKTEKEAVELLQKAIGFGSPQFYYWVKPKDFCNMAYKDVLKEIYKGGEWRFAKVMHANAPQDAEIEFVEA